MSTPKNPDTIVIRNAYYPQGLTERQIYDYYQKHKDIILKEVYRKSVLLFIFFRENEHIVRRFLKNKPIRLTPKNYSTVISGRTVSISVETGTKLTRYIVDIDATKTTPNANKIKAVSDVLEIMEKFPGVKSTQVFMTGTGYHIYGNLKSPLNYITGLKMVRNSLKASLSGRYGIGERRTNTNKFITLDLSPMYSRGSHVVPYALNRNGTICQDVTKNWKTANRSKNVIK